MIRRLIICHNQVAQTQKRDLIKQVLECAIGRMLEYKREIVNLDAVEYLWPDDLMVQMKLTPDDIAIPTPAYYVSERKAHLENRKKYINDIIESIDKPLVPLISQEVSGEELKRSSSSVINVGVSSSKTKNRKRKMKVTESSKAGLAIYMETPEEKAEREARDFGRKALKAAIILIQSHERARRDRCIGAHVERQYTIKKKLEMGEIELKKIDENTKENAAVRIQKTWRSFATRQRLGRRKDRVEKVLDMSIPSWQPHEEFDKDEANFQRRLDMQLEYVQRTEETMIEERARVHRIRGPGLMEDITDEIREWFIIWYNELGFFDVFPVADAGGTVLVVTGQTITPKEYLMDKWEKTKVKGKGKSNEKTKKQLEEEKKLAAEKARAKAAKDKAKGWRMPNSKTLGCLQDAQDDFIRNWSLRDESRNPKQTEYLDIITDKLCYELQLEMREIVDELMRLELERLEEALKKDHIDDDKPLERPMPVKEKKKKKRKRQKKDPLADSNDEDMFIELVKAKVIRLYPNAKLSDWLGDLSYQNYEALLEFREANHRMGEIKQLIMEFCVLPLGSKEVHRVAPLVRSVCISGLPRSGKTLLVNAICSELGALLFDLTPKILVGQYVGKKNEEKLINMVAKLSRVYAPSIVFIEGGEKPWWKKIPETEKYTQPKRLARLLPKFVKGIKPGDQVLFLTTSSEPYKAGRPFMKIHNKFITIPITDYSTLYLLYKELLMKYHGVDRRFDVSVLAKVSVGLPIEFVREVVEKVLTIRRRITLKYRPLKHQEIMDHLVCYRGPGTKEFERFRKWENKTPLGRKRAKLIAKEKEERDKLAALAAKRKK